MPMISLEDLGGKNVKPGDTVTFKVKAIEDGNVELDYNSPEVDAEAEAEGLPETEMPTDILRKKMVEKHGQTDSEGY